MIETSQLVGILIVILIGFSSYQIQKKQLNIIKRLDLLLGESAQ